MSPDRSNGMLCISLDFELMWGAKEKWTADGYGRNVIGAREAVPRILDRFARVDVHATWATVGFLFAESKEELFAFMPPPSARPAYRNAALSSYRYAAGIGRNESDDPLHFGASIVDAVVRTPGQEIATHTFSHFYPLEEGATVAAFDADLTAAQKIAASRRISIRSIVFPRNQYAPAHLDVCAAHGLQAYRGNRTSWLYRPAPSRKQSALRRVGRLFDSYVSPGDGGEIPVREASGICNVPASLFLRPRSQALAPIEGLRLNRIVSGMTAAANAGSMFHLWWHPHNFGGDVNANLAFLDRILAAYVRLRDQFGMRSMNMNEVALAQAAPSFEPSLGLLEATA